jgi:hypothetical protein
MSLANIYRISAPVGTCKEDYGKEWITLEVLVGSYLDAETAAANISPGCFIECFDGRSNRWRPVG